MKPETIIPPEAAMDALKAWCPAYDSYAISLYLNGKEVEGQGYSAGGKDLGKVVHKLEDGRATIHWGNPRWEDSTFKSDRAVIRNVSTGKVVCILNYPVTECLNGPFWVEIPEIGA